MHALVVGGGVGGLATALALHATGVEVDVYESAPRMLPLGVGINVLPHAARELERLGRFEEVPADEYYFRLSVRLTTGAPRLGRWNSLIGVAHGERRRAEVLISVWEVL